MPAHVFRWDLDKTYLKTDFDSVRDLVRTARLTAAQRENVPGSAALMRSILDVPADHHRVYFISGSPSQMRAVLEAKFALDGFEPDGFVLKPTLNHMIRGQFRAVRSQVAYKLGQLLSGRTEVPVRTPETLFGDDAESDAFIYALYSDILCGRITHHRLRSILKMTGAYPFQIAGIEEAVRWVVREDVVRRIIIHLDQRTATSAFEPFGSRCVPVHNHLQTALTLCLDGTVAADAIRKVGVELTDKYGFDDRQLANLAEDLVRRLKPSPDRVEGLIQALQSLPETGDSSDEGRANRMVGRLVERLQRLPRQEPRGSDRPARVDYAQQWKADQLRRAIRKRERRATEAARHQRRSSR
ncbi:MAG: phosphatase domain-containing protein [Myxococcota bacterium]